MTKTKKTMLSEVKKNPWVLSTFVLAVVLVVMMVSSIFGFSVFNKSANAVGEDFVDFINAKGGSQVELVSSKVFADSEDLVEVIVKANGQEMPVHVTKDGKFFVQLVAPLTNKVEPQVEPKPEPKKEVPKADKPVANLFVMTHCPYGTQAEKGFIPTIKAMEELNADLKIRFVHYFMHGDKEEKESYRQVCIREEQSDKYLDYLTCFLGKTGSEDDSLACGKEAKIDEKAVTECIANGKAKEYYEEDSKLSEDAGVRGSPTLVINGVIAESGRNPQAYLDAICKTFNNVPEACGTISVSSENPSPGFGYGKSGSNTNAQC